MNNGLIKALRLEYNHMLEAKYSFLFYLTVPALVIALFAYFSKSVIIYQDVTVYQYFSQRILALVVIFVTSQLTILRIVGEYAPYGTLDRDLLAISRTQMYLGKVIANAGFVLIQSMILYLVAFIWFPPVKVYANPVILLLLIFFIGLFGIVLGFTISIFARNKEQAIQLVPFIILLLLMVGDFFFVEIFGVPEQIKTISLVSPLSTSYKMLQVTIEDTYGFIDMITNTLSHNYLGKLALWIMSLSLISIIKFNLERGK